MIAFMPRPYDDELIYSWFARYYVRTGYMFYKSVAEELFDKAITRVSWNFFSKLTEDAINNLTRYMPMEEVVEKHTMFPQYSKFSSSDRREKGLEELLNGVQKGNRFYRRKNDAELIKCFRYCPVCAKEDRIKGEAYWHRKHHLDRVDVCAKHGCRLENSTLETKGKAKGDLVSAESVIPDDIIPNWNVKEIELKVAKYVSAVFEYNVDLREGVKLAAFFDYHLANTKYCSSRGGLRYIEKLFVDFMDFYNDLENNPIQDKNRLRRIFSNQNFQMYEICLLGLFLDIPVKELCEMKYGESMQATEFDETVWSLKKMGLSNREVAMRMKVPLNSVKVVAARLNKRRSCI